MTNQNNGGPAFPVIAENGLGHVSDGLSMRDYFAAMALQGLISIEHERQNGKSGIKGCAIVAYEFADAMLAQRDK